MHGCTREILDTTGCNFEMQCLIATQAGLPIKLGVT